MARHGIFLLAAALAASGCANSPISREYRAYAERDNVSFQSALLDPEAHAGRAVAWGGVILETINRPGGTELVVLHAPLDESQRPVGQLRSQGRFIARTPRFLDPANFSPGRRVTVAGEVLGKQVLPVGEAQYRHPVVRIRQIYIWPWNSHFPAPDREAPAGRHRQSALPQETEEDLLWEDPPLQTFGAAPSLGRW